MCLDSSRLPWTQRRPEHDDRCHCQHSGHDSADDAPARFADGRNSCGEVLCRFKPLVRAAFAALTRIASRRRSARVFSTKTPRSVNLVVSR